MRPWVIANMRLQEMMGIMAEERGGSVFATDERYVHGTLTSEEFSNTLYIGSVSTMGS